MRKRKYLILAMALSGAVLAYAAFFTAANDFSKIAFSFPDNDCYEIDSRWFNYGRVEGNHYNLGIGVYLYRHNFDVHYLVIDVKTNSDKSVSMRLEGILEGDDPILVFSKDNINIENGPNIIEIPSVDISLLKFEVEGADYSIIKRAYFCNHIYNYSVKEALICALVSTIIFFAICFLYLRKTRIVKENREL